MPDPAIFLFEDPFVREVNAPLFQAGRRAGAESRQAFRRLHPYALAPSYPEGWDHNADISDYQYGFQVGWNEG